MSIQEKDNTNKVNKKKLARVFFAALLPVFTFFIFGPLELYLTNIEEFGFSISNVFAVSFISAFVCLSIFVLIGYCLPDSISNIFRSFLFGLGLAIYAQGSLMQFNYDLLNGQNIDWSKYGSWGLINAVIWILCILIPMLFAKKPFLTKIIRYVSVLIVCVQIITVGYLMAVTDDSNIYLSNESVFELSNDKNIVVFILDAFDARFMSDLLADNQNYEADFEDFTFYPNTIGMFPFTKPSISFLLTGTAFENEKPFNDYLFQAYDESQLLPVLKKEGYEIFVGTYHYLVSQSAKPFIDNFSENAATIGSYDSFVKYIFNLTSIKYFPHYLKKQFTEQDISVRYIDDTFAVADDLEFYNQLLNNISIKDQKTFKFYHLHGAHAPVRYDESLQPVSEISDNYVSQQKGALKIVKEYLNQLKENNIYDQTMVLVMADHGSFEAIHDYGSNPLLMIKEFNADKPFEVSNAPISYEDFLPTILNAATDTDIYGKSANDWNEGDYRERRYLQFSWVNGIWEWTDKYLPDITEYLYVTVGKDNNFIRKTKTGVMFTKNGVSIQPAQPFIADYTFGESVLFTRNGTGHEYLNLGMSNADLDFTWTCFKNVDWFFKLDKLPESDVILTINLLTVFNEQQRIILSVNGHEVSEQTASSNTDYVEFRIPKEYIDYETLLVNLYLPDAAIPYELGINEDRRTLGLAITSIKLEETE